MVAGDKMAGLMLILGTHRLSPATPGGSIGMKHRLPKGLRLLCDCDPGYCFKHFRRCWDRIAGRYALPWCQDFTTFPATGASCMAYLLPCLLRGAPLSTCPNQAEKRFLCMISIEQQQRRETALKYMGELSL